METSCCTPGPALGHAPKGRFETIAGIECYVSGDSRSLILYCCDVFGHRYEHNQANCDYMASRGFTVIAPNQFPGEPVQEDDFKTKGMEWFMKEWLPVNSTEEAQKRDEKVLGELRQSGRFDFIAVQGVSRGRDAVEGGCRGGMSQTEFCYSAAIVAHLKSLDKINALAIFHPSFFKPEDTKQFMNVPTLFNCAETDQAFVPELKATFEKELAGKDVKFITYPNTSHGFAARGDPQLLPQRNKSLDNTILFYKDHGAK